MTELPDDQIEHPDQGAGLPVATVLVLFTYQDGYPTVPIGVYPDDVDRAPQYEEPWVELPNGHGGRGCYTTHDHNGVAMDLVRYEVEP